VWLQAIENSGLGSGLNLRDHGTMQIVRAAWAAAMPQPLVELPNGISQPGELKGTKGLDRDAAGLQVSDPVPQAAS
jgi:hypothetical protein